ncbi:MAG: hypothetical protein ACHQ1H_03675 [Nitrososphaerales archaeon]
MPEETNLERRRQKRQYELAFLATLTSIVFVLGGAVAVAARPLIGCSVIAVGICFGYLISPKQERPNVFWATVGVLSAIAIAAFSQVENSQTWSVLGLFLAIAAEFGAIVHFWRQVSQLIYWSIRILYYLFIGLCVWSVLEGANEEINSFLLSPIGTKPDFFIRGIGSICGYIMGVTAILAIGKYYTQHLRIKANG